MRIVHIGVAKQIQMYFFYQPAYVNYTTLLTTAFNLAPKIASVYAYQDYNNALELEDAGNWNDALTVYYNTILSSDSPSMRKWQ